MTGRPSVNKRQREMARKERQTEKLSRRDERRAKRNVDPVAPAPEAGVLDEPIDVAPLVPATAK
jgi:hypothetical protein